jgi:hypothetical protein
MLYVTGFFEVGAYHLTEVFMRVFIQLQLFNVKRKSWGKKLILVHWVTIAYGQIWFTELKLWFNQQQEIWFHNTRLAVKEWWFDFIWISSEIGVNDGDFEDGICFVICISLVMIISVHNLWNMFALDQLLSPQCKTCITFGDLVFKKAKLMMVVKAPSWHFSKIFIWVLC